MNQTESLMDLDIVYNDKRISRLNGALVKRQGLSENDVAQLKRLHTLRHLQIDAMSSVKPRGGKFSKAQVITLREMNNVIVELDFQLQDVWKFGRDAKFHRHWETPHCTCPKLDNRDSYPYQQYVAMDCPIHGA